MVCENGASHLERLTIDGREFEQSAILRWLAVQAFTRTKLARCSTSWDEAENYRVHVICHSWRYREIASLGENLCDLRLIMSFIREPQIVQMTADFRKDLAGITMKGNRQSEPSVRGWKASRTDPFAFPPHSLHWMSNELSVASGRCDPPWVTLD